MKFIFRFIIIVFAQFSVAQTIEQDTIQANITTEFGQFRFVKSCKKNSLGIYQGVNKFFDKDLEKEAEEKNIFEDKLKLKIKIDETGKIVSYKIIMRGKLENFNTMSEKIFQSIIKEMAKENSELLNCNNKVSNDILRIKFVRNHK